MELGYKNDIHSIEISKGETGFSVEIDGAKASFNATMLNTNTISINEGNSKTIAYAADDENFVYVNIEGYNFSFRKPKAEETEYGSDNGSNSDHQIVKAPMPGSIVKVEVQAGQKVSEGAPLIIIEAMKMETTIYAAIDGIVKEVNVAAGEQVDSDKALLVVEKENIE